MGMFNNYIKEDKMELTNVNSRIDNIEIGGRNLLTGTKTGKEWSQYTSFEYGVFYSENDTNGEKYICSPKNLKLSKGTYTLSFDFKTEGFEAYPGTTNLGFQLFFIDGDYNPSIYRRIQYNEISTDWKHYIWTFDIPEDCDGSGYIRFDNDRSSSFTNPTKLWIKNPKLEKGNKATDWTPAPEDLMPYVQGSTGSLLYHDGVKWDSFNNPADIENAVLLYNINSGVYWGNMESIKGERGAGYVHTIGENVSDSILENPEHTESLVSSFGFRAGDYTISTDGTIWYYNGTSFERGINLKS